jgi:hypothetical protein
MIGSHPEVAMLHEDISPPVKRVVGKAVTGNKLCIPNQIELSRRISLAMRLAFRVGLFSFCRRAGLFDSFFPGTYLAIDDYLAEPDTRVLGIIREPAATIGSMMTRGGQSMHLAICHWRRAMCILATLQARVPERFGLVSFEELVTRPETVMRGVAPFLGLGYAAAMLEGYRYTPYYPGSSGIDAEKAAARKNGRRNLDLHVREPEAWHLYLSLCETAARPLAKHPLACGNAHGEGGPE